jgi:hypothetical protein
MKLATVNPQLGIVTEGLLPKDVWNQTTCSSSFPFSIFSFVCVWGGGARNVRQNVLVSFDSSLFASLVLLHLFICSHRIIILK